MVSGPHMWCVKWLEWNSKQWAIADLRHNLNDRSLGDRCWFNWHTVWKCMHQNSSYNYIRFKSSVAAQVLVSNTHFWCFYWPNTIFVISIFFRSFIYLMNDERHQPPEHKLTHTRTHSLPIILFRFSHSIENSMANCHAKWWNTKSILLLFLRHHRADAARNHLYVIKIHPHNRPHIHDIASHTSK